LLQLLIIAETLLCFKRRKIALDEFIARAIAITAIKIEFLETTYEINLLALALR
jgi:hypothetical protein